MEGRVVCVCVCVIVWWNGGLMERRNDDGGGGADGRVTKANGGKIGKEKSREVVD